MGIMKRITRESLDFNVEMEGGVETTTIIKIPSIDIKNPTSSCGDDGTSGKSIFTIFLLGLVGGLIALLTPCVFPMIPVTVSYFTNKSHNKKRGKTNAILYGLFIFLIYVLITIPFHLANDTISPEIFNNISTNIWLNLLFFVIFVVFAISFFGFFISIDGIFIIVVVSTPPSISTLKSIDSGL